MKNTIRITFALLITMFISSCSSDETTKLFSKKQKKN